MFADFVEFTTGAGTKICVNRTLVANVTLTYNWRHVNDATTVNTRRFNIIEIKFNNNGEDLLCEFATEELALNAYELIRDSAI